MSLVNDELYDSMPNPVGGSLPSCHLSPCRAVDELALPSELPEHIAKYSIHTPDGSRRQSYADVMDACDVPCFDVTGEVRSRHSSRSSSAGASFMRSAPGPANSRKYEVVVHQSYEDFQKALVTLRLNIINDIEQRVQDQVVEGMMSMQSMVESMQHDATRRLNEALVVVIQLQEVQNKMEENLQDVQNRMEEIAEVQNRIEETAAAQPQGLQEVTGGLQEGLQEVLQEVQSGFDEFKKSISDEIESVKKQVGVMRGRLPHRIGAESTQSVSSSASSAPGSEASSRSTSHSARKRHIGSRRGKEGKEGSSSTSRGGFGPMTTLSDRPFNVLQKQLTWSLSMDSRPDSSVSRVSLDSRPDSSVSHENNISDVSGPEDLEDKDAKRRRSSSPCLESRRSSSPCWRNPSPVNKSVAIETMIAPGKGKGKAKIARAVTLPQLSATSSHPVTQPRAITRQSIGCISASSGGLRLGSTDPKVALPFTVSDVEVVGDIQDNVEELLSRMQRHMDLSLAPTVANAAGVSDSEISPTRVFLQDGEVHIDMLLNVPKSRTWSATALALRCQRQAVCRQASTSILTAVVDRKGHQLVRSLQGSTLSGHVCVHLVQNNDEKREKG